MKSRLMSWKLRNWTSHKRKLLSLTIIKINSYVSFDTEVENIQYQSKVWLLTVWKLHRLNIQSSDVLFFRTFLLSLTFCYYGSQTYEITYKLFNTSFPKNPTSCSLLTISRQFRYFVNLKGSSKLTWQSLNFVLCCSVTAASAENLIQFGSSHVYCSVVMWNLR